MGCFLGIDGGGTRTAAWLADGVGKVLGRAESGPSNPLKVGLVAAEREILKAVRSCLREAAIPVRPPRQYTFRAMCAGIAGVDRPAAYRPLLAWMRRRISARRYLLTSDAAIALAAEVRDGPGIVVIAGTGSIAYGRDDGGKLLRAGGWGIPFDDRGSGYELGRKAVAAALEAFDGRAPQTCLTVRICQQLKLGDITEIVSRQLEPKKVAALFPLVVEAAREGDLISSRLCNDAGRDLADLAAALLRRADFSRHPVPVAATGGVFSSSLLVRQAFVRHLRHISPYARVEMLMRPPVEGALWLARNLGKKQS